MTGHTLRETFLRFFEARDHRRIESDPLIPSGDPTVLFTSAGMNQFKDYFLGTRRDLTRAVSCQKCLRTSDLEHVGRTASHHTFFEMLGNFSFGDYFKREAIQWAWEFLTQELRVPEKQLWVTVFEEDEEARQIWRKDIKVPQQRITRLGEGDNFWPAHARARGPNGPCGPCSEVHVERAQTCRKGRARCAPGCDCGRFVEVWNLVFTQFERREGGVLEPLRAKHIDTGMGLERLAAVLQGVDTDYETDVFAPIMEAVQGLPGRSTRTKQEVVFAQRAIADHLRAIVFLIVDGVLPSNESRGYVLRMLIRRAHRLGRAVLSVKLPSSQTFLCEVVESVERAMKGSPYAKDLMEKRGAVRRAIEQEEGQFVQTLDGAMAVVESTVQACRRGKVIPGEEAFKLYDTYGFPLELTIDIAQEEGLAVDREGFERALRGQQERSRKASQFGQDIFAAGSLKLDEEVAIEFLGYDSLRGEGRVKGIWKDGAWVPKVGVAQTCAVVLDRSPFYGEAGGQVGDTGRIDASHGVLEVLNTTWVDRLLVHHVKVSQGWIAVDDTAKGTVDAGRRLEISRSHTATHLLHWGLRHVLGPETVQAGSLVEAERLRFDFSALGGLDEEQRVKVETLVNERIRGADGVSTDQMDVATAKQSGALALFGEKYGRTVRVVTIGDYSRELCGGTHLPHTGSVGTFRIIGESSIAAGTRRIEAVVGEAAQVYGRKESQLLHQAAGRLGRPVGELVQGLEELLKQLKQSEHTRQALGTKLALVEATRLIGDAKAIGSVKFVATSLKGVDRNGLAVLADALIQGLQREGVVFLTSTEGGERLAMVMAVTKDLAPRVHAGELLKGLAPLVEGHGGGRPTFAQGGGKNPSGASAARTRAEELIRQALGQ